MKTELIILGAGGHAKVVIATARSCGIEPAAVYDDDESKLGSEFCGLKIMGKIVDISESQTGSAFIAIGSNAIRKTISQKFKNFTWPTLRHPTAFICETAKIGNGSIICAGAVIQPDVVIGDHAIINTGSNIDHDCEIGDYTHICPGCNIAGSVNVSEGAMLGTGVSETFTLPAMLHPGQM